MQNEARFDIGQTVTLFSDPECSWIITGILVGIGGLEYRISNGYAKRFVYECEITDEVAEIKKIDGYRKKD